MGVVAGVGASLHGTRQDPIRRFVPSIQVRMLMITVPPMSMRPSSVAEFMCGRSTTLPVLASLISRG